MVDVMPLEGSILGFLNRWYVEGYRTAIKYSIDDQHPIKIFTAPFFIASKLEAFKSRGNGDGRTSTDFEDIVFVLENRRSIWKEMEAADETVRAFLVNEFKSLRSNRYIREWIDGHSSSY